MVPSEAKGKGAERYTFACNSHLYDISMHNVPMASQIEKGLRKVMTTTTHLTTTRRGRETQSTSTLRRRTPAATQRKRYLSRQGSAKRP